MLPEEKEFKRQQLIDLLEEHKNIPAVARHLGVSRQAIHSKIQKFDIPYNKKTARKYALNTQKKEEIKEKIMDLILNSNFSISKVCQELNIHHSTVYNVIRNFRKKLSSEIISHNIKRIRTDSGLTQKELKSVKQGHLSKIENGADINFSTLIKLAEELKVNIKEIIF